MRSQRAIHFVLAGVLALSAACVTESIEGPESNTMDMGQTLDESIIDERQDEPYEAWGRILSKHMQGDCIDYQGLVEDEESRKDLDAAVTWFAFQDVRMLSTREEKHAYWFNAYNTFMIAAVVENFDRWSQGSVLDPLADGSVIFQVRRWQASSLSLSLDMLENGILRGDMERANIPLSAPSGTSEKLSELHQDVLGEGELEERLHFALHCSARGCPSLRTEPYDPDLLDAQLEEQTTVFLNDPVKGAGPSGISQLLTEYYPADFEAAAGSVAAYVERYNDDFDADSTIPYDWDLNQCP